jgi:hypothetical protein
MITDALVSFLPIGSNQSMVGGAGVSIQIGNIIDLLGYGVGVAPSQSIIGNVPTSGGVSLFGAPDAMGVGGPRPELNVSVGTAFTTSTSATLEVALQGAADTSTYQPGTWYDFATSGPISVTNLAANEVIFRIPWLPPFPPGLRPRYLRLYGIIPAATDFTAGTIASATVVIVRDDQFNKYGANNYVVA